MSIITIQAPIVYSASVRKGLERNWREEWFGEWVEIDLLEVSEAEAPLAAEWELRDKRPSDTTRIRIFDGKLYTQVNENGSHPDVDIFKDREAIARGKHPLHGHLTSRDDRHGKDGFDAFVSGTSTVGRPEDYKNFENSARDIAIENATRAAQQLLIIDGMIWEESVEPVLHLTTSNESGKRFVQYDILFPAQTYRDAGFFFKLSDWDSMVNFGDIMVAPGTEEYGHDRWVWQNVQNLQVHIQDAFTVNLEADAILNFVPQVLRFNKSNILDISRTATDAWWDTTEALDLAISDPSDENLKALCNQCHVLVELTEPDHRDRYRKEIAALKDRFDNRPISLSFIKGI